MNEKPTILPLRIERDLDALWCIAPADARTKALGVRLMVAHVICMALFITVVLAIPAWLFGAANILLSPKVATWLIRCDQRGVRVREVLSRTGISTSDGVNVASAGAGPLGLGAPPAERSWAWSELRDVRWTEAALALVPKDGEPVLIDLELTSPQDIARLGEALASAFAQALAGGEAGEPDREGLAAVRDMMKQRPLSQ